MARTVCIAGSSGLVGTALTRELRANGVQVLSLVRRPPRAADERLFDPDHDALDEAALASADAVVDLCGANISARWSPKYKELLRTSRLQPTATLARHLARMDRPIAFLQASAIGLYGSSPSTPGDAVLEENSPPGTGFLARLCVDWEAASEPARASEHVRLVTLRFGIVLAADGGALPKMLLPFRFGAGGRVGHGQQWLSWISLQDTVRAIRFLLENDNLRGPFHLTAPEPVPNREFARIAGRVLRRPSVLPTPASALRMALGREFSDETVLSSTRAIPRRLLDAGFTFHHPDLETALRAVLQR